MVIAQHVTDRPIGALYRELLFEPLGLTHTWLPGDQPLRSAEEPATVWVGDRSLVDRPLALRSFGDLYGTVDDVLRFGRACATAAGSRRRRLPDRRSRKRFGIPSPAR